MKLLPFSTLFIAIFACAVHEGNKDPIPLPIELYTKEFYSKYSNDKLPKPPEGKKWVFDTMYSDEFNGNSLDIRKWDNQIPTWKGRPPGLFIKENVVVKDSCLQLHNTWLETPIIYNKDTFTIGCAAVKSMNSDLLFPLYTEVRMKASNVSLSSTFWLMSAFNKKYPDNANCDFSYATEIDIVETVGGSYNWDKHIETFNSNLKSNSHFRTRSCEGGPENFFSKGPAQAKKLGFKSHEDFHTYGIYWVDAQKCYIYLDGELFYSIQFDESQKKDPFDLPLGLRMVTETYNWLKPPSKEILNSSIDKTTFYDWVRTYRLENK